MEAVKEKPVNKNKKKTKPAKPANITLEPETTCEGTESTSNNLNENSIITNQDSQSVSTTEPPEPPDEVTCATIESTSNNSKEQNHVAIDSENIEENPIESNSTDENVCNEEVNAVVVTAESTPSTSQLQMNFESFLDINKQIVCTLENIDSIPAQPSQAQETYFFEIRPYTEQQLNALYYNSELDVLQDFTKSYIDSELRSLHFQKGTLYDLLVNYLKVRGKITGNKLEIEQHRKEYLMLQQTLWSLDQTSVTGNGVCQDGKSVSTSHVYNRAVFHRSVYQNIKRTLNNVQKLVYDNHVLYSYSAEDLRLQVELHIEHVIENIINTARLTRHSPVSLSVTEESFHLKTYTNELRSAISVLFAFQRKCIRDQTFLQDTRNWMTRLVAVLLRVANYQDHLFLLHHILRCPAGISTWSSSYIQVPLDLHCDNPFSNYQINHLISVLSVILNPIEARKEFLKDVNCPNVQMESNWVMVDSDGEEDDEVGVSLRENDLVAILNQLPLADLFRCLLMITRTDEMDNYNIEAVTEQHILRSFAFYSVLLRLLHAGLKTYSQPKYNQFSKRLSRFMRHIVQYSTDQWELFLKNDKVFDKAMAQRLQAEYDAFFLRAIYYLYTSQKLSAWQFLAVIPYNMVTIKTLWKIYYFLHMPDERAEEITDFLLNRDFKKLIWEQELRGQFEEKLCSLQDAEVYYLLNTFANMALARNEGDMEFIHSAAMDVLQVGFISQNTQETCSKSARILLSHITSKYPALLSDILKAVYDNMDTVGSLSLYLYEEIPLTIWIITDDDLRRIERLLLNFPVNTSQTKLARMILSRLNWDIIPYEKHCETALLVLKAVDQEPLYIQWGWQTVLRLKLHVSDGHFQDLGRVQEAERCEIMMKGIRQNQPLPSFVAILMSTWGHLVPLICTNGLKLLNNLQTHQKHEAVLFALYQIMPIFITCQECIINCDKFQEVLVNLLNADRGYVSYAKSFIVTQDTVLQQFGNMVETQIVNYKMYNLESPRLLVRLWMNSLVSISNWDKDHSVLYLLDIIIRTAFFHQNSLQTVYENFKYLYQLSSPQETTSIINIFKRSPSSSNNVYGMISTPLTKYPWLAYVFLEIEHEEKEQKTGFWMSLLKELSKQKGKPNVDSAIKNVASNLKMTAVSSSCLCIYRWAQQALDAPLDHPLLPLFWQKFFILFLTRLPNPSSVDKTCIGDKFFEGLINFAFLKRIKRKLQETTDYYKNEVESKRDDADCGTLTHLKLKHSVFQAFSLWLEEPRLQSGNLLLQSLPSQYEPNLLSLIIQENSQVPWYEYIDRQQVIKNQEISMKLWKSANFRDKSKINQPLPNPGQNVESGDPVERILRRLRSYDPITPPPELKTETITVPTISLTSKEDMLSQLKPCFDTIHRFANDHNLSVSEQKATDCTYQDLLPQLFSSVSKKIRKDVPCKGKNQTVLCSGPAKILLEFQEAKRNERIDHEININRQSYESRLKESLQLPSMTLCTASVAIQQCVRVLQQQLKINPASSELGVELFYHILPFLQDSTVAYLPAKSLFLRCVEKLGESHICGVEHEMPRLLQWILKKPTLGAYIAPYFLPNNSGTSNMLLMYSTITKEMSKNYDVIVALISRFDMDKWLREKTPYLSQRSQLIDNIVYALSALGYDPPVDSLTLHGLYRKHLVTVFEFQFPEHYGEILLQLLKASNGSTESSLIAESVWMDVLNSLAKPAKIQLKAPLRDQLRYYAQKQQMLSGQEFFATADLLARHFTQERFNYGIYGLYPKCRSYIDVFVLLLGMTGHGVIISMLNSHPGLLGDKICEKIWPYIREMYAPWLVPYSMNNLKDNMATWIQQLADDRSTLLPWIPSDTELAQKMIKNLCECIHFVLDTLPASFNILSFLWQWYVTSFAHNSVKDHVLVPIHAEFTGLPWSKFWPSLVDLEMMLKVIDQYLPECHSFLGTIFLSVPWLNWINSFTDAPLQIKPRIYSVFLNLLVKLSIEPNIRKNNLEKARSIIIQAENFDWAILDPAVCQHVMDWAVMSFNSGVIFKTDVLDLDYRLLHFLKVVSGYNNTWTELSPDLMRKRQIYVKSHLKLLSVFVSKHKQMRSLNEENVCRIVNKYLHDFDTVVTSSEEMEVLLKEILSVINVAEISTISFKVVQKWIENKTSGAVINALLKTIGSSVVDYKYLAVLCELTLTSYFNRNVIENTLDEPTWKVATELTEITAMKPIELEQVLIEEGAILTLNVILLQRLQRNSYREGLLNHYIGCVEKIKIREPLESKIPLLWSSILNLGLEYSAKDEPTAGALLYRFAKVLLQISEENGSGNWGRGLLNAIGLSKSESASLSFRFICRAMAGYILAQLPEMKVFPQKIRITPNAPSAVGTPGGNVECTKVLLGLDFHQSQGKIKDVAAVALSKIQDPSNSLHNANSFLWMLIRQFYIKPYLRNIDD
ncbi:ectopic P granules protein 5 homolog [Anthonomus grandis grandis]|uniref:ectopic P granules protein 5 homolog n=1 Tax=Anthonomus grandis grandis TaxID=2921223 RepID=UPI0021650258|nr:ectopic P granules protein 5 homolog [Anthonomus grandis grandis]